jgi:outer membrane lipoprotein SlyB
MTAAAACFAWMLAFYDAPAQVATAVGAVAGAVAGNAIENRMIAETYNIHVRMDDGRTLVFNRNTLGAGVREGAYVRVDGTGFDVLR